MEAMSEFDGITTPMVTPFDDRGDVDEERLRDHVSFLVDAGVHGLFPGASLGEFGQLSTGELRRITAVTVEAVDGDVPVYAGTGAAATDEAVRRTRTAAEVGADGVVVVTPYYAAEDQRGLRAHYDRVAEATDLPVILYQIPALTGQQFDVETVARLDEAHDNVVGLKDSSGDLGWAEELIRKTSDEFAYLQGIDSLVLPSLAIGAEGGVNGTTNVAPAFLLEVYDRFRAGDVDGARVAQMNGVNPLAEACGVGHFPAGFKYAASALGRDLGRNRDPVRPLSNDEKAEVRSLLREVDGLSLDAD